MKRALVVEDDEATRELLAQVLLSCGFKEVVKAEDGLAGLEAFKQQGPFNLVTSDREMPNMDGFQFLRGVKKENPAQPVLFISAGIELSGDEYTPGVLETLPEFAEWMRAGTARFFTKPLNVQQIREAVAEFETPRPAAEIEDLKNKGVAPGEGEGRR